MRRVQRIPLGATTRDYLVSKQGEVDALLAAGEQQSLAAKWKSARATQTMTDVLQQLQAMMGKRARCMYCVDSHGCDIEHFYPKAAYPERMFTWYNLLLCCPECGRLKGDRFPVNRQQQPLLINPSEEEPWDFLVFDPETGNLNAKFDLQCNDFSSKGMTTVVMFKLDAREGMAEGYQKTYRALHHIVDEFLCQPHAHLIDDLLDADDHGLLGWCFKGLGQQDAPFSTLKMQHPTIWQKCLTAFAYR